MQIDIDEKQKEVKDHGSFAFPLLVSNEELYHFEQGSFSWHWHPEIELTYIVEGNMIYKINQKEYKMETGEALFCNSNALHSGTMIDDKNCKYISITFHPRLLYGYKGSEIEQKFVNPIVEDSGFGSLKLKKDKNWSASVIHQMLEVIRLWEDKPDTYTMEIETHLMQIWIDLYKNSLIPRSRVHKNSGKDVERLRNILEYIHQHYEENFTLDDVAKYVNVCKSECCRFFKTQMGQTIFDYTLDYRVSKSLLFLKNGDTITEAGAACGFQTPAYYSRVFKRIMGCSPRTYRKEFLDERY